MTAVGQGLRATIDARRARPSAMLHRPSVKWFGRMVSPAEASASLMPCRRAVVVLDRLRDHAEAPMALLDQMVGQMAHGLAVVRPDTVVAPLGIVVESV